MALNVLRGIVSGLAVIASALTFYLVQRMSQEPVRPRFFYEEASFLGAGSIALLVWAYTSSRAFYERTEVLQRPGKADKNVLRLKIDWTALPAIFFLPLMTGLFVYCCAALYHAYRTSPIRDPYCHPCFKWVAATAIAAVTIGVWCAMRLHKTHLRDWEL